MIRDSRVVGKVREVGGEGKWMRVRNLAMKMKMRRMGM